MADLSILAGATSQSINVDLYILSTGGAQTGLVFNSTGLTAYYSFTGTNGGSVVISLQTLAAANSAYASGGFKEIDGTNMPGVYRLDLPNAALASSKGREVIITLTGFSGMATRHIKIELTGWDNQDAVHGGLSCLPNTACTSNASLLTSGVGVAQISNSAGQVLLQTGTGTGQLDFTSGVVKTNVTKWNGTNVLTTIPPDFLNVRTGTAQGGGSNTITLDSGASSTNNLYQNCTIYIQSGTGAGQTNIISTYVGSTKVATVTKTWAVNPDITSIFYISGINGIDSNNGVLSTNVTQWNGTNVATPATAGIPDVNIKNMNNVAATSITAINANQGTTQPVNFTGTAGSALVKGDAVDIGSTAASSATVGTVTNLTNAPTSGDFTATMKTSLNAATPASVTGAVGSVTGLTASDVSAIKTNTDKLTFTVANQIDANIQYVNDVQVNGVGTAGSPWGP